MAEVSADVGRIKVPPQAIDVEQAVLCAMMLDKEAVANAVETIDETYFYKDSHRRIYLAIVELFDKHESADLYTITELLKRKGDLDEAGGSYTLAEIANVVPSSANIVYHLLLKKKQLHEN